MRIDSVEATWISVPIPEERQHVSDFGRMRRFDTVLVRVRTEDGLVGLGEAKAAVGSQGDGRALVALINHELGPLVTGEPAGDIARLWELMYHGSRAHHALERGYPAPAPPRRPASS